MKSVSYENISMLDADGKPKQLDLIMISNEGEKLKETNYWEHELAKQGIVYITCNAGSIRVLIPNSKEFFIPEIKTGKIVEIETSVVNNRSMFDLFFMDGTPTPFCLSVEKSMIDRSIKKNDKGRLYVYTKNGIQHKIKYKVLS